MCGEAFPEQDSPSHTNTKQLFAPENRPLITTKIKTNSVESKYPRAMLVAEVNAPSLKTTYIVKKYIYKKNYFKLLCSFLQSEMGFISKA